MLSGTRTLTLLTGVLLAGCTGMSNTQTSWGDAPPTETRGRVNTWASHRSEAEPPATETAQPAVAYSEPYSSYDYDGICQVQAPRTAATHQVLKRPERVIHLVTPPEIVDLSVAVSLRSATGEPAGATRVSVPRVVNPGHTERVVIAAEYATVRAPGMASIPAVCRVSPTTARAVQDALAQAGLFVGPSDGLYDEGTRAAVERFKRMHNLYGEGLTLETLDAMNVPSNTRVSLVSR